MQESEQKLQYLNEQLARANLVELRQAISRVIEDQINAMMLARSRQEYAFKVIDPPTIPKQRISPRRALIVVIGTFIGVVVAIFLALVLQAVKSRRAPS
jgi:LPS O-antigen subunit length determinant protein (WzzB/FepE family)